MVDVRDKRIFVDSMVVIYLLEQNPRYGKVATRLLDNAKEVGFSTLLYGEVLAGIYRAKADPIANDFLTLCTLSPSIRVVPFSEEIALTFAKLRASYPELRPPDAIHLATALTEKADLFLTNDKRLPEIKGLRVVQLSEAE